ncbi:MAG: FAD-binding protein, partial [Pseudonocardiaceae bacterium]|nr:FAD-binding protein [Pseudonocardiaceae bacterium]
MTDSDVIVIGGGTAGLAAATRARRAGLTVVIVSDGPTGGDCTFSGCVPSKTLLHAAASGLP